MATSVLAAGVVKVKVMVTALSPQFLRQVVPGECVIE